MNFSNQNKRVLPVIVIAQFACTSLWFAGNAVLPDIVQKASPGSALGNITSAVQFGFIVGTLLFAIFTVPDRYSPSKVFFVCAVAGALSNLGIFISGDILLVGLSRFITGFFLAGIYPVGMKIAADHYNKGLGKALGYLVGALVLGTGFPHLIKFFTQSLSWKYVIATTSILSIIGGSIIFLFVPDGPYRTKSTQMNLVAFYQNFKNRQFKGAALGYFGHMWELYTFWAFVPIILTKYLLQNSNTDFEVSFLSFIIIASGFVSCIVGGYIAGKYGSKKTASTALVLSMLCCIISPFLFQMPFAFFVAILVIWGMSVVADSPQFSTLIAQAAQPESKGTALTIVNCIGFSITIISIQVFNLLTQFFKVQNLYFVLSIGPIFGLIAMRRFLLKK